MKTFAPGDLVVIKKQVQTTQEKGPAKARMNARGPYRILEESKPGTYKLQKLPGVQGAGRRGRVMKESAARLTKIPSTLVIHKPTAGIDTRLATYRHAIVDNPLENILGLHERGRYRQAEPGQPFAYDKIEDLWQEEVDNNNAHQAEDDSDSEDSHSSDSDDDGNSNGNADDSDHFGAGGNEGHNENPESNRVNDGNGEDMGTSDGNGDDTIDPGKPTDHDQIQGRTAADEETTPTTTTTQTERVVPGTGSANTAKKQKASISKKRKQPEPKTRTSERSTKRPARYRQENQNPEIPQQTRTAQAAYTRRAHQLYKRIRKSRDKLFFIKHVIDTTNTTRWYVVQAKLHDDDTESTRNEGKYTVWFYIREHTNSKNRQLRNCRYWPEIHQVKPNGTLGPIVPIRPGRAEAILQEQANKYRVYQQVINLLDDGLVGPFDFAIPNHYQQEANRIAFEEWEDLKSEAVRHALDVSNIEEVIPLR